MLIEIKCHERVRFNALGISFICRLLIVTSMGSLTLVTANVLTNALPNAIILTR